MSTLRKPVTRALLGVLAASAFLLQAPRAPAQAHLATIDHPFPEGGAQFGRPLVAADFDGDGVPDLALAASFQDGTVLNEGRVYLVSGRDRSLLNVLVPTIPQFNSFFGAAMIAIGDVDGDAITDLAVASPNQFFPDNRGQITVYSGRTATALYSVVSPDPDRDGGHFSQLASFGDIDGDGVRDFAGAGAGASVNGLERQGRVYIFSGRDGAVLRVLDHPVPQANGNFGRLVTTISDVDGDGQPDVAISAFESLVPVVYVYSGADASPIYRLEGPNPADGLTAYGRWAHPLGDVDGDGRADFTVGDETRAPGATQLGRIYVYSGATGALIYIADEPDPDPGSTGYGVSIAALGDIDGDGLDDFVAGAPSFDTDGILNEGRVFVLSGRAGAVLMRIDNPSPRRADGFGTGFGFALANLGTDPASGAPMIAVTAPHQPVGGQVTIFLLANTVPGGGAVVTPVDPTTGSTPVSVTFEQVDSGGSTTVTTSGTGAPPPSGFKIGQPPTYYEISTTAGVSGQITVCINYTGVSYAKEENIRVFHRENGVWIDRTLSLDTENNIVCALVPSLSPFAIFEREQYAFAGFFSPVANPPAVNVVRAGASLPVKFRLADTRALNVLKPGYPRSSSVACDGETAAESAPASTAGQGGLQYDATADQYVYVWKTEKSWQGTCRRFELGLADESSHSITVQFK